MESLETLDSPQELNASQELISTKYNAPRIICGALFISQLSYNSTGHHQREVSLED